MKLISFFAVFLSLVVIIQARFGQEHTKKAEATYAGVRDTSQGTGKEEQAGNLSGAMVRALLAAAPTCDQQDRADEIIDLGISVGGKKKKEFIKFARAYRQLERNTPHPGQPSKLCKKTPRHKELRGLKQAQDPTGKKEKKCTKHDKKCKKHKGGKNKAETNPVGGVKMPKIIRKNHDYYVNGNAFNGDVDAAHERQCNIQRNKCLDKFNGGDRSFTFKDCEDQTIVCKDGPPVFD
jgi:hypothetical protein